MFSFLEEAILGDSKFVKCDWFDFYAYAIEMIPPNAPKPPGKGTTLQRFMDSNHAGNMVS